LDRIFSGVQPTGNLHIGNYLGAIKNFVELQNNDKQSTCYYCVVDLHAITVWQEPAKLKKDTLETVASFIAAGIDPKKVLSLINLKFQHIQSWLGY
jgi:tryptophanyl-tRNA synthetase